MKTNFSSLSSLKRRNYSAAPKQVLHSAQKQVLHARQKVDEATKATNMTDVLKEALFKQIDPVERDDLVEEERCVIAKAWSRYQMVQLQKRSTWERAYCQGKLDAMEELRKVSKRLVEFASVIDYSLPPLNRRIPTDTPPNPQKFPFKMALQ